MRTLPRPAWCLLAIVVMATWATTARAQQPPSEEKHPFAGLFPVIDSSAVPPTYDFEPSAAQSAQEPTEPAHTGIAAIFFKTLGDFKAFPRRESTWVILGIGAGAAGLAHPADHSLNERMVGSHGVKLFFEPGHILGSDYVQVGTAVGLYTVGRYIIPQKTDEAKTNRWSHLGFDLLRAQIVSQVIVQGIKVSVRRDRPTGECCAFPSGHSAATFATAAVLERHLGYRAAIPTLAIATYVGASRLHDNRHYLSDVLFGAAVGTATGWTVVGTHGRSDYSLVPVPTHGGVMLALVKMPSAKG
jgi:PAP2 superfamily protein